MKSRKEVNHSYYIRKVKPFRQKKQPIGYNSFVCPICKRRSFMRNLKYTQPFSVDYVMFTGDKGIKWFKGRFDPEQKELIIQLIKLKLIQTMQEFGITAEDLGIRPGGISVASYIRETPTFRVQTAPRISSSLNKTIGGIR